MTAAWQDVASGRLGGAPDDEGELLQMREQHAEEARDAFALQTTKSWQEVRYWLVRTSMHGNSLVAETGYSMIFFFNTPHLFLFD
jgi:hypothetical protein